MKRISALCLLLVLVITGTFTAGAQGGSSQPPITPKNAAQVREIAHFGSGTSAVNSVAFNPNGTLLASGSDQMVTLWDVKTGESSATLVGPTSGVTSVAFSPDGSLLAAGSTNFPYPTTDEQLWLWDVKSGKPKNIFKSYSNPVTSVAFSPDGSMIATASGYVFLSDVTTGKLKATLKNYYDSDIILNSVAFSPNGLLLAAASTRDNQSKGNAVQLWDVKSGQLRAALQHRPDLIDGDTVAFSPDGSLLASGSQDPGYPGAVLLWDVKNSKLRASLQADEAFITTVAFSPDGSLLAAGGLNGLVLLWDVKSNQFIASLQGHTDAMRSVAFNPDGTLLASGGDDGMVRLWGISSSQVSDTATEATPKQLPH